jgi:hypothetical protein
MTTTYPPQTATTFWTQDSWIKFDGTAEQHGDTVWLKPSVDESLTLELAALDVRTDGEEVKVRVGASLLKSSAIKSDDPETVSDASSSSAKLQCDGNPTACIGDAEFCCDSGKIIGSCFGYWRCR